MVLALGVFLLPVPFMYFDEIKRVAVGLGTWFASRFAREHRCGGIVCVNVGGTHSWDRGFLDLWWFCGAAGVEMLM